MALKPTTRKKRLAPQEPTQLIRCNFKNGFHVNQIQFSVPTCMIHHQTSSAVNVLKTFLFEKKRQLFFKSLIREFLFLILPHVRKNQILVTLVNLLPNLLPNLLLMVPSISIRFFSIKREGLVK